MPLTTYDIIPEAIDGIEQHEDTVALYPMTFGADIKNTYPRMQRAANLAGHLFRLVELTGQDGQPIHGKEARDALQPGKQFDETCRQYAADVGPLLSGFDTKLGIGHSLGGVLIGNMFVQAELEWGKTLFDGIEQCDSLNLFNLKAKPDTLQNPLTGYSGFFGYQAKDTILTALRLGKREKLPVYDPETHGSVPAEAPGLQARLRAVGPLMRSTVSMQNARTLSTNATLPYHVVNLSHGLSGSVEDIIAFQRELRSTRSKASLSVNKPAPLDVATLPGRHSQLLNPVFVANNAAHTRQMVVDYRHQLQRDEELKQR